MSIYLIDGKKFDTEKADLLYSDGAFSNTGIDLYKTKSGKLIQVNWSNWQGSHDGCYYNCFEITGIQFIDLMKSETQHPERAMDALKKAGFSENMIAKFIPDFV